VTPLFVSLSAFARAGIVVPTDPWTYSVAEPGGQPNSSIAPSCIRMKLGVGIHVATRRGLVVVILENGRRLLAVKHFRELSEAITWLEVNALPATIGIAAQQGPQLTLLSHAQGRDQLDPSPPPARYEHYRVCDYYLARRGIGRRRSPSASEPLPESMALGAALFASLRDRGLRTPRDSNDREAMLLEVVPLAAFATLLGAIPPSRSSLAGRAAREKVLSQLGVEDLPRSLDSQAIDALVAAASALAFAEGRGHAIGEPEEGLIVLPVFAAALLTRYGRSPTPGSTPQESG